MALITGEEKIVPPSPSYFVCTVESMPLDRPVDFLAVDEIQLCGDPERGHVFTDRLLHARGVHETMLLGADTIRPLLRRLVPEAEISSAGRAFRRCAMPAPKKLTRLPPRSAVVAFAVADVFALAELMRRQRGGTAVVMGALVARARATPRSGLFQSGEVDYLVATDAIGMGLNMDLDHVAFARLVKFDGCAPRRLARRRDRADRRPRRPAYERRHFRHHRRDFGARRPKSSRRWKTTASIRCAGSIGATHGSITAPWAALIASLETRPRIPGLVAARAADDHAGACARWRRCPTSPRSPGVPRRCGSSGRSARSRISAR